MRMKEQGHGDMGKSLYIYSVSLLLERECERETKGDAPGRLKSPQAIKSHL